MWLQNPETKEIWDLLPDNPYNPEQQGCAFLGIKGMGYQQNVTQEQVEVDYFISQISSANKSITGILYFNGDKHLQAFQSYIGDFRRQFELYYSSDGEFEPYDDISSIYHKPVVISQVEKTEKNAYGWYDCSATFTTQSDVWKRNVNYSIRVEEYSAYNEFPNPGYSGIIYKDISTNTFYIWGTTSYIKTDYKNVGDALVYPYKYEYVYGGRNVYSIDIPNDGREAGCVIKITNKSTTPMDKVEWFIENKFTDAYGREQETVQRSAWYFTDSNVQVTLQEGYTLYVDSNDTTQEAKVIYPNGTSQSVVNWQEPSFDYINFIRIKHGSNRLVFYLTQDADIEVYYQEQKELI